MRNLLLTGLLLASSTLFAQSGFSIGVNLGNRGPDVKRVYVPPPPYTAASSSYRPGMLTPNSAWNARGSYNYRVRANEPRPQYRGVRLNPAALRIAPRNDHGANVKSYVRR